MGRYKMEFTGERYVPCKETENNIIEREHWQRYVFARDFLSEQQTVLDIASGEGYGSDYLAQKVDFVIGVDISEEAIEHAQKKYLRNNLRFCVGSVEEIPLDNDSIDAIISFETLEHVDIEAQLKFLREIKRILRKNGYLIISCPNIKIASDLAYELWGYKNIYHKKEYEINEFEQLLLGFFKNVKLLFQRTETNLVLSDSTPKKLDVLWGEKKTNDNTQNIIAICSDFEIRNEIANSVILDIENTHLKNQKMLSDIIKANDENYRNFQWQKGETDRLQKEWANQQEIIREQQKVIYSQKETINIYQEDIKNVQDRNQQFVVRIKYLEEDLKDQKHQNEVLKKEQQTLKESVSWRLTEPLRKIRSLMCRIK